MIRKVSEVLACGQPTVSFEVFPPKRDAPLEPVKAAVKELAAASPSFISVTYGAAGGEASANTSALASFVQNECGVTALAHLTCVMASRDGVSQEADRLSKLGVRNILALRGDVPAGCEHPEDGHFSHASELVAYLRSAHPEFCLGGACYPDGHPECATRAQDLIYLKEKVDAGLDFLTTQMFFDNVEFYAFLARLRGVGIHIPVIAGVMPVTNGRQIARICKLSGTSLPARFRAIVDRFGDRPEAMLDAGVAYATEQIVDLFANGVEHVHVYTMNRPETGARIMRNLHALVA